MQRGLLVIGGAGPAPESLYEHARGMDLVVAADAGLERAIAAGLSPDLVVGDMDSLSDRSLLLRFPRERVMEYPAEKDETDTEIGLRLMRERGCTEVTIAGGGGGRIDHLLGIAALFERVWSPLRWLTDCEDIRLVAGKAELAVRVGSLLSVFPLGDGAAAIHSEGLRWPLDGLEFRRGYGGISNRATAARVLIEVGVGKLLVIQSIQKD